MSQSMGESFASDNAFSFDTEIIRMADDILTYDNNDPTRALNYLDEVETMTAELPKPNLEIAARRLFRQLIETEAQIIPINQAHITRNLKPKTIKRKPKRITF